MSSRSGMNPGTTKVVRVEPVRIEPGHDLESELEFIAQLMDSVFEIPGTRIRFGLDSLVGLIPGIGDAISSLVSLYILSAAHRHGVSKATLARMAANIGVDFALGAVPFVGDAFDVVWKSNSKNVALLKRHTATARSERRKARVGDWLFLGALVFGLVALLVGSIAIAWFALSSLGNFFALATG
ncbi:MAG: DUF4112 domain-containing protein [Planctomycetaceae bacterium]